MQPHYAHPRLYKLHIQRSTHIVICSVSTIVQPPAIDACSRAHTHSRGRRPGGGGSAWEAPRTVCQMTSPEWSGRVESVGRSDVILKNPIFSYLGMGDGAVEDSSRENIVTDRRMGYETQTGTDQI